MLKFPPISPELLKALDKAVPSRCPSLSETDREIWLYAGKRALVEFLHAEAARQQAEGPHGSIVPS
jgi:hypothetical protein